jgi:hypothetical protein
MDFAHTIFVCIANWSYLIEGFGERDFDHITWLAKLSDRPDPVRAHRFYRSIGATITLTASNDKCIPL